MPSAWVEYYEVGNEQKPYVQGEKKYEFLESGLASADKVSSVKKMIRNAVEQDKLPLVLLKDNGGNLRFAAQEESRQLISTKGVALFVYSSEKLLYNLQGQVVYTERRCKVLVTEPARAPDPNEIEMDPLKLVYCGATPLDRKSQISTETVKQLNQTLLELITKKPELLCHYVVNLWELNNEFNEQKGWTNLFASVPISDPGWYKGYTTGNVSWLAQMKNALESCALPTTWKNCFEQATSSENFAERCREIGTNGLRLFLYNLYDRSFCWINCQDLTNEVRRILDILDRYAPSTTGEGGRITSNKNENSSAGTNNATRTQGGVEHSSARASATVCTKCKRRKRAKGVRLGP